MFNSTITKTVNRQFDSSYNLTDKEFEAKLVTTVNVIKSHLSKVEELATEIFRIGYARCFASEKRNEQKEAIASFRDRIEELLGKRFSRAFGATATDLDFTLPTQSELESIDWFAHEGVTKKKEEKFGTAELLKYLDRRVKKIEKFEKRTPEMQQELSLMAVCITAIKKAEKDKE